MGGQLEFADLILEGTNNWNVDFLNEIFSLEDVLRIKSTPLPPAGVPDSLTWHFSRDGRYSVKSSYNLAARLVSDRRLAVEGDWKILWSLSVPPRVKDFLWRACRDCLPTKVNLFHKNVVGDKFCILCGKYLETSWHVFVDCCYAKSCWLAAELGNIMEDHCMQVEGFSQLIFQLLKAPQSWVPQRVAMTLWQIWKERNSMLWEGKHRNAVQAIHISASHLAEWEAARCSPLKKHGQGSSRTDGCPAWHPPDPGAVKVNVDAAFFADTSQLGIGMVLRDAGGAHILGRPFS